MGDVKLGELLSIGRKQASVPRDPEVPEGPKTTYPEGRPRYCGAHIRNAYGTIIVCSREVERLRNGLPTGRCAECRVREMSAADHRRHELRMLEHAEKNATRMNGAKRRTDFGADQ